MVGRGTVIPITRVRSSAVTPSILPRIEFRIVTTLWLWRSYLSKVLNCTKKNGDPI